MENIARSHSLLFFIVLFSLVATWNEYALISLVHGVALETTADSVPIAKLEVAFFQLVLPVVIAVLCLPHVVAESMHKKWDLVFLLCLAILILICLLRLGVISIVKIRNFVLPFIWFYIGLFLAKRYTRGILRYLFLAAFLSLLGGAALDIVGGRYFWLNIFPTEFIASVKNSPVIAGGLFGNKLSYLAGNIYYRVSGLFVEPHHFGHMAVILTGMAAMLGNPVLLFLCAALAAFSLVKSSCLFGAITFWAYVFFSRFRWLFLWVMKSPVRIFMVFISLGFFLVVLGLVGSWLIPQSTIGTHLEAFFVIAQLPSSSLLLGSHMASVGHVSSTTTATEFSLLQSDSGLASLVFSIGIFGTCLFFFMLSIILFYLGRVCIGSVAVKSGLMVFSMLIGWAAMIPFVASGFTPIVSALPFLLAGIQVGRFRYLLQGGPRWF